MPTSPTCYGICFHFISLALLWNITFLPFLAKPAPGVLLDFISWLSSFLMFRPTSKRGISRGIARLELQGVLRPLFLLQSSFNRWKISVCTVSYAFRDSSLGPSTSSIPITREKIPMTTSTTKRICTVPCLACCSV